MISTSVAMASYDITAFGYVLVLMTLVCPTQGGSCWRNIGAKNECKGLISTKMTKKECCLSEPSGEKFYSEDESDPYKFDVKFLFTPHKCGVACQDGCSTFKNRCNDNQICKVKNGIPKCLCNPDCARHSLSKKGKVCGSDGVTYRSHCQMLRQNCRKGRDVKVNYFGSCRAHSCEGVECARKGARCVVDQYNLPTCVDVPNYCRDKPMPYETICTTYNVTFPSICHMNKYNIEQSVQMRVQYYGACRESKSCHRDPSCKHCLFDDQTTTHVCLKNDCPSCHNAGHSPAVCGSDGVTYENECMLRRHACLNNIHLRVKHIASCQATKEDILWTAAMHAKRGTDDVFTAILNRKLNL